MDQKENTSTKSRRIAKNTAMLYVRMLLLMLVSLYTSRITLQALGVDNLGIYSVVGGLVSMFSLISGSLTASISRYITFELGKGADGKLRHVFSTAVNIQICLALVVFLVAETVGLWFLNNRLVIPADRLLAANWVYQFSLLTFCASLIMAPYNALIIAHERMSAFAFISIYDGAGKLAIAYLITIAPIDRLVWYAALLLFMTLSTQGIYFTYCLRKFKDCIYKFVIDKKLFSNIGIFAGWNFLGAAASILRDSGGDILINLFGGPAVNAARSIAGQVSRAVTSFVGNFQMAMTPQITKSYASGDHAFMTSLVIQGSRISYYILYILALPLIINAHYILTLWLGEAPPHAAAFTQLVLICALCESYAGPLINTMLATGQIKVIQMAIVGVNFLNLPLSYIALRMGLPIESVVIVAIFVSCATQLTRLLVLRAMIRFPVRRFFKEFILNVGMVSMLTALPSALVANLFSETFYSFIGLTAFCVLFTASVTYAIGCSHDERAYIRNKLMKTLHPAR